VRVQRRKGRERVWSESPRQDTDTLVYTPRMESAASAIVVNYMAAVLT
jgi:hypothetical protein